MSIIYGPVSSWRLGRSLGIDLLSTKGKTCSFDCVYCQLGKTVHPFAERKQFVTLRKLTADLERANRIPADYATFAGIGEPALASNLGEAIVLVKSVLKLPVAVLTNSSLMTRTDVRRELSLADVVVAKLDAPNEELFRQINRPVVECTLDRIIQGIKLFREEYPKKLALQMMFISSNRGHASEMAIIAEQLSPDEVQINTPLRPCAIQPLGPDDIRSIQREFFRVRRVVTVYEASIPEVVPLSVKETFRRRPE